jgi:hypothetical protein
MLGIDDESRIASADFLFVHKSVSICVLEVSFYAPQYQNYTMMEYLFETPLEDKISKREKHRLLFRKIRIQTLAHFKTRLPFGA